ncbi:MULTISPECIES: PadR family transcriptional regulator [unclassified Streptomyces]|uniref:PadR family transcriptional regulator n=1 Tax=unclassified Streptomyces TaxID=2593676 RepID=UPI00224CD4D8|nr:MULTISPECIES: PadR family transcriptional regulator [unclassified Streptomyces]MCX4993315.1 PadR family transcriptional regulator [Streptomyces sp. NBC_00568]MCX5009254.1 PadR family transcriptional regulator [Streptomyces sp. NBC_00638]
MATLRMTLQTQLVLRALLEDPARQRYGLELCELAGLPSGTIYPILARLEQAGWVDSTWEDPAVHEEAGRPRRRFYRITHDGAEQARETLARAYQSRKQPLPGWAAARPATDGGAS